MNQATKLTSTPTDLCSVRDHWTRTVSVRCDRKTQAAKCRTGVTLIEVLGTLSVMLILAVSAVTLLGAITNIGKRDGDNRQSRANIARLASEFRTDLHHTDSMSLSDDETELRILLRGERASSNGSGATPDLVDGKPHTLTYSFHRPTQSAGHEIRRTEKDADQQIVRVESYTLIPRHAPSLQVDDEMVTLLLGEPGAENDLPPLSIVARRPSEPETP